MEQTEQKFEQWCVVELMGHQRTAGMVREVSIAGQEFLQLDVPGEDGEPKFSQYLNPTSIYRMTPVEKEIAVSIGSQYFNAPAYLYEMKHLRKADVDAVRADYPVGPPAYDENDDVLMDVYSDDDDDDVTEDMDL